jgi:hypothetical protein
MIKTYPRKKIAYVKSIHNAGFFSCCSLRLDNIIQFFNKYKSLPIKVDSSIQFEWYKNNANTDITFDYFTYYKNISIYPVYKDKIDYCENYQYTNYKNLNYKDICPFIKKYFTPSLEIQNSINHLETKYALNNYEDVCVLFYRGNDKLTETRLCSYNDIIERAKEIFNNNNNILFLIQSDESEFIETMTNIFPKNSFYFKDEIRHMKKQNSTVDIKFKDSNYIFSKYYLAITVIMSKCKHIICGTGNCSIWIMFYRENANNVQQYLDGKWI